MIHNENIFLQKKSSNYLVVSNNLLLSLSHWRHANNYTSKFFLLRARDMPRNPPLTKGSAEFPLFNNSCLLANQQKTK